MASGEESGQEEIRRFFAVLGGIVAVWLFLLLVRNGIISIGVFDAVFFTWLDDPYRGIKGLVGCWFMAAIPYLVCIYRWRNRDEQEKGR